jgi:hypothetical protein
VKQTDLPRVRDIQRTSQNPHSGWCGYGVSCLYDELPVPAALSWLRRRGPQLPEAVLQRLFRKRQVIASDWDWWLRLSKLC